MPIDKPQDYKSTATQDRTEDDVALHGGIAAFRLANDQLFVSVATQRRPSFLNETTNFLEKNTDLCLPIHGHEARKKSTRVDIAPHNLMSNLPARLGN